ncbi:MAG: septum formation initiator family protein [Robiginitomaculum sp.]|nr:septum formation initiator family protein [Robiginitomaculum sp.]
MSRVLKRIRLSWPFMVLLIAYGYLGYHTLGGSLGVLKWADYSERSESLNAEITRLQAKRETLELRASQLRASNLDLDRLDEEARRTLNVSGANDIVIWLDETP